MSRDGICSAKVSWNPVTGCNPISTGCQNCYAKTMAERFRGGSAFPNGFDFALHPDRLSIPRGWNKPRQIFLCSMTDLFFERIPDDYIMQILDVVADTPRHTYWILTKRPERMVQFFSQVYQRPCPPNLWVGVTVEHSNTLYRIKLLKSIDAARKFVCFEPLLGDVGISQVDMEGICWVIVGGETGVRARKMEMEWVDKIFNVCRQMEIPIFFKHWGRYGEDGRRIKKSLNTYKGEIIQEYPT